MVNNHRRKFGITERYWTSLSEDQKIKWKLLSRTLTFLGALAVTKTGINYIDWVIAACIATFSFLLIESQRSYTRYSIGMRKKLTRISIASGVACIFFVGIIYFSQAAVFSLASTFTSMPPPHSDDKYHELRSAFQLLIYFCAGIYGIVKAFRKLNIIELIYRLPRQQMIKLLIHKEYELEGFYGFICFEIGVILAAICYSSVAATLIGGVLEIINITIRTIYN
ncbi:hypothetical protein [Pseudomonas mandelii]|jgi:hypothetical protein|uniref:Uncharacterized protein n=1 Tax=Pseudomonas mandelii TaxID=75612 RepID=A0A502IGD7_9PSED|nr:hypothetical protein [Pseudomonas mandelii]TPG84752.1 hypothetical protein EAH74_12050 [Pseudomonas mandelii]